MGLDFRFTRVNKKGLLFAEQQALGINTKFELVLRIMNREVGE